MAEYIERAKAKEELLSWARCIKHPEHLMTEDAMCVLDSIPAADVVEVVRCGECRWYKHGRCRHPFGLRGMVSKNLHWCRYGERRNNAAD